MIYKIARYKNIHILLSSFIFLIAIFTILPLMENMIINTTGANVTPDSSFFYSASELHSIVSKYSDIGIDAYIKSRWTFDLLWPVLYFYFMISVLIRFKYVIKSNIMRTFIITLPLLAMSFDILENILCSFYMARFAEPLVVIAKFAAFMSAMKWIFVFASFAFMLYLPIKKVVLKLKIK